jgi:hypothetical protein
MVDGLNGKADVNGDRYIYVGELFKYIEKTVPTIVNQAKKQRQEPKIYPEIIGSDKDFPVFQYMP